MKNWHRSIALAGLAVGLFMGSHQLSAQERPGRGNFDPEQMRQRMLDNYRERLEVKDDAEWKVISDRIEKVMQARREVGGGMGGGMAFGRPGGRGGDNANAGGNQGERRGPRGGEPNPEAEALQKALESKASAEEVKAKLAKLRESRKAKEASLEKAQDDLRKVLSVRQEAAAVLAGLLK